MVMDMHQAMVVTAAIPHTVLVNIVSNRNQYEILV